MLQQPQHNALLSAIPPHGRGSSMHSSPALPSEVNKNQLNSPHRANALRASAGGQWRTCRQRRATTFGRSPACLSIRWRRLPRQRHRRPHSQQPRAPSLRLLRRAMVRPYRLCATRCPTRFARQWLKDAAGQFFAPSALVYGSSNAAGAVVGAFRSVSALSIQQAAASLRMRNTQF